MKSYSNEVLAKTDLDKIEEQHQEFSGIVINTLASHTYWIAGLVGYNILLTIVLALVLHHH